MKPVSVLDVATYILETKGEMSTMKLQKLVYYSQAWHGVWENEPLFLDKIEAWKDGPVVPVLFNVHKGSFTVSSILKGDSSNLSKEQRESVDEVLSSYGGYDGATLSRMSHDETPWKEARAGVAEGEWCDSEIPLSALIKFYGSL